MPPFGSFIARRRPFVKGPKGRGGQAALAHHPMGEGRGKIFHPGFIPPDDCGPQGDPGIIQPENEDDETVEEISTPRFGYNQGRSHFRLRQKLIFFHEIER